MLGVARKGKVSELLFQLDKFGARRERDEFHVVKQAVLIVEFG